MDEPRWLDEREMAAWRGFVVASNLIERRLEQQLKESAGLSHTQYEILVQLSAAPDGSLRMTDLADRLVTSKSGLTYQVTQLEKSGLVGRRSCPSDVRGVFAEITEQGWRVLREAAPGHVATVREVLIDVLTPEQLTVLAESLGTVGERLRAAEK
ncbi:MULTISPECIES: MarR family winged helix-turn-helix transcriptional regulator [unclassified Kitasatospora]|uniref:MarR family winged helix-turn-helix transcriptional regulator n=1 Tax=unclassified Kitasatospora TaxID=2633591 RepID=UPI00070D1F7B|nr:MULTISPECIES: MarR family transcriptional regulator [unclassified Kitasatospora]KQV21799.1 MarR family transcriptional regulator [Kitasatospora sp. Root107]KRB75409.1 MarR family transcriptional regulator [Kitasatospora sp. Root187]